MSPPFVDEGSYDHNGSCDLAHDVVWRLTHVKARPMSRIAIIYRRAVQELVALFVLLAAFGSSFHLATAVENSCSFDYVATDGLLASAFKEFPREVLLDHPELVKEARSALPDVRRIFASSLGYSALVGWAELPEDYSGYSNLQAERKLVERVELGKRTVNAGKSVTYDTDFGPPISLFLVLNYQDNSKSWRDVAMDVIATSHCLFSIKISGPTRPNDDAAWPSTASLSAFGLLSISRKGLLRSLKVDGCFHSGVSSTLQFLL